MMSEQLIKQRGRLNSQALTEAQQMPNKSLVSSITIKPQEDPDAPPILMLETQINKTEQGQCQQLYCLQIKKPIVDVTQRLRTKSEDKSYTIISFLENKIRNRTKSQQIIDKIKHFQQ